MYVATTIFTIDDNTSAAPGDLFIAQGAEGNDGYITGSITWKHVKTGYDETLNPKLELKDNTISLQTYVGNNIGSIRFVTNNTNLVFASSEEVDTDTGATIPTITLSNVWGTF